MTRTPYALLVFVMIVNALSGQVNYTANDTVPAYSSPFRYGANMGAYHFWRDEQLADIAAGNAALDVEGLGVNSLRPTLPEWFLEYWGYDIRIDAFRHYDSLGIKDNVVFIGYPSAGHMDSTFYCSGTSSRLFANMYLPIWDNGENGTPVNDSNYYALYLWKMVSLYHPYVKFWEVWNEPDYDFTGGSSLPPGEDGNWWEHNPDPCKYALHAPVFHYIRLLRISYEVIKYVAPDDYVTTGGIGYPAFLDALLRNTDNPADGSIDSLYPLTGGAYFDVLSFHSYPHIDNSVRVWDNSINGFKYFRYSDRCVEGMLSLQTRLRDVLFKYGYDGSAYPEKLWIITESNIPSVEFDEYIGSPEAQRNYLMKSLIACQQNDILQFHVYTLADGIKPHEATSEFQLMGLYSALDSVPPYQQQPNAAGIGFKTTSMLLRDKHFDPGATTKMELPANIRGGAFKDEKGEYTYVLWAVTSTDKSENASGTYSFPASLKIRTLHKREWDFATMGITSVLNASEVELGGSPVFFTDSESELPDVEVNRIYLTCHPNPFGTHLNVQLDLPDVMTGSLALYDISGNLVTDFFSNWKLAKGGHFLELDSYNIPAGVYALGFVSVDGKGVTCKIIKH